MIGADYAQCRLFFECVIPATRRYVSAQDGIKVSVTNFGVGRGAGEQRNNQQNVCAHDYTSKLEDKKGTDLFYSNTEKESVPFFTRVYFPCKIALLTASQTHARVRRY